MGIRYLLQVRTAISEWEPLLRAPVQAVEPVSNPPPAIFDLLPLTFVSKDEAMCALSSVLSEQRDEPRPRGTQYRCIAVPTITEDDHVEA